MIPRFLGFFLGFSDCVKEKMKRMHTHARTHTLTLYSYMYRTQQEDTQKANFDSEIGIRALGWKGSDFY